MIEGENAVWGVTPGRTGDYVAKVGEYDGGDVLVFPWFSVGPTLWAIETVPTLEFFRL